MKHLLLIYFLLIVVNNLTSQTIKLQDTLYCNYLGQEQGLLQLNVKGMALDDLGYLWAGTEDGLYRFNSNKFKPYLHNPKDSTSINDDHIRSLHFTRDTLWIATNSKGIIGFVPSKNTFFNHKLTTKNADTKTSYTVLNLTNNLLLFSVKNNVIVYNRSSKKSTLIPLVNGSKETFVTDVLQIDKDTFWLASSSSGILELNLNTFDISETGIIKNKSDLCFYKTDNKIYIGSKEGMFIYNTDNKQLKDLSLDLAVNCFYNLNTTQFYFGTKTGLYVYDIHESTITPIALYTKQDKLYKTIDINQIIGDAKGNLWIGTEADGLFHYNTYQKKFNTLKLALKEYPLINNISPFQFLKGKDSTLWIGSKYGVVKYAHIRNQFKLYKSGEPSLIYTIARDKSGTIWAGGFTSGLLKYDSETDRFRKITSRKTNLPDNDVIEIIPNDFNTLWVCTWSGGVHEFNIKTEEFEELKINGERLNRARTSLIDSKGNIWLGTDQGAYKVSKSKKIVRYHEKDSLGCKLSSSRIFSIKEDTFGNIWFGTSVGLTKLDVITNKTTLYYEQKGLPNDFIYTVLIAENNNIWVSTNYGISELDIESNTFKNYTVSDGLQNNEFNGKAAYKDDFGNFYIGGISGINIFNPEKIIENPYLSSTYIESVELFNKPLEQNELFKDILQFKHNENVLTFNFNALNYLNPEKSNYAYKMDGFDTDWRPITKNRSTTYTNLDPGKYTFRVKASNDIGKWNEKPDELAIIIIPAWYNTLLFKITALVMLLISSLLFYVYKTNKLKKDKLNLEYIVKQRTQEIQNKNKDLKLAYKKVDKQNNNITFLMRELTHRVKNNLQIISSLLNIQANSLENESAIESLKVAKNRILTISHIENKIAIEKETIAIDVFIKDVSSSIIGALSDDEHLKFKVNYSLSKATIKNLNTTLIGLILNELITNTTKYAFDDFKPENELNIVCEIVDNMLRLIISDNGKGYPKYSATQTKSLGIELVMEMVEQLNGTMQTNSTNGTENIIDIPI